MQTQTIAVYVTKDYIPLDELVANLLRTCCELVLDNKRSSTPPTTQDSLV